MDKFAIVLWHVSITIGVCVQYLSFISRLTYFGGYLSNTSFAKICPMWYDLRSQYMPGSADVSGSYHPVFCISESIVSGPVFLKSIAHLVSTIFRLDCVG